MTHLTEPGIRAYVLRSLRECKTRKLEYYTWHLNLGLFVVFVALAAGLLWWKYTGKKTAQELETKREHERIYILEKLKGIKIKEQQDRNMLITGLPVPEVYY